MKASFLRDNSFFEFDRFNWKEIVNNAYGYNAKSIEKGKYKSQSFNDYSIQNKIHLIHDKNIFVAQKVLRLEFLLNW